MRRSGGYSLSLKKVFGTNVQVPYYTLQNSGLS
jgi:hypothetical protein